ncbi:P-loop containing nucleoside triphosphate hydrolase protein [Gorgonomyces haynaldii]|nr:P-loop containing nucleoside triphosphate hydrolase protein [Gorgonomyces haynaldii]
MSFSQFDLDARILRAIAKLGFKTPTPVQETAIPLGLEGKDILARARTGSGKTAAYIIPMLQKILVKNEQTIQGLVLVPTRELAQQVWQLVKDLTIYCQHVTCVNLAHGDASVQSQALLLNEQPRIVIATPTKMAQHLTNGTSLKDLESLVIDEADLILSYGYDKDVETVLSFLPKMLQSYLMSATLTDDVEKLKKLVLRNPAILKLEESGEDDLLVQYYTKCQEKEKFLLTYFMLKLRIHPFGSRKTLIFVNTIERCYKLKLFLEQFGIKSCALNAELPVKSRYHIVQEFNRGVYDYIIATDDTTESNDQKKDGEYGVSRGIDFKNVQAVINFDMPMSSRQYQHRVGRTARGVGNKGYSLSFVTDGKVHSSLKENLPTDEHVLERVIKRQTANSREIKEFHFDMTPVEAFRYRAEDALSAVTPSAVKEARLKEIKQEILNSEKLKAHFEDNPQDMQALRHDKPMHQARVQPQLKRVPEYLLPKKKVSVTAGEKTTFVPFRLEKKRGRKFPKKMGSAAKRKLDPLKQIK